MGDYASSVIIGDVTGRNANVLYELGIAHTVGKPFVLLAQSDKDIPFDLRTHRHIIYEDNEDGYKVLRTRLRAHLKEIASGRGI